MSYSPNGRSGMVVSIKKGIDSTRGLALLFLAWPVLFGLGYVPALFGEWPLWYRLWIIGFLGLATWGLVLLPKLLLHRRYTRFAGVYTLTEAALILAGGPVIGIPFVDAVPLMGAVISVVVTLLVWVMAVILAWSAHCQD